MVQQGIFVSIYNGLIQDFRMIKNWFSGEAREGAFFRRIDWSAFWAATVISLFVYFITLGPSVTLEDSGELAVAGDYLGVPHPPGYPIWTICAWLFARIFSFVTFRGQPTPCWSISLLSSVFGALAAGVTAMLITRSVSDMLRDAHDGDPDFKQSENDWLCWAGGVGGSLVFAFSPVMWSQATIVEVYTLNAFFLMWIFLLSYRWMRKPSDRILWLTAFVFGLGMTNYQVLLLAALPLVIVIFLRNIGLFRDFLLIGIPVLLTCHVLQIGSMLPAAPGTQATTYAKFTPIIKTAVPSVTMLAIGVFSLFVSIKIFLLNLMVSQDENGESFLARKFAFIREYGVPAGIGVGLLGALFVLLSCFSNREISVDALSAPLIDPSKYTSVAAIIIAVIVFSLAGACTWRGSYKDKKTSIWLVAAGVALAVLFIRLSVIDSATIPNGYMGTPFEWLIPKLVLIAGLAVFIALCCTIERGLFFALPVIAVQVAAYALLSKGAMNGLHHPSTWWFWWPVIWNFIIILMAWMVLPNGRTASMTMLFAELGVSFYIYMPIVSDLRNPPMNWGYPRTWEGFKHAITRGQYEKIKPTDVFNERFLFQIGSFFTDMRVQFTMLVAPLGFLPFTLWSFKAGKHRVRAMYAGAILFVFVFGLVALSHFVGSEVPQRLDKALVACILLLFAAGFLMVVVGQSVKFITKSWKSKNLSEGVTVGITLASLVVIAALSATKVFIQIFTGGKVDAGMGQKIAALLLALITVAFMGAAAYYLRKYLRKAVDFKVDMDEVTQQWMLAVASGFFVMSVLLVVLANPKGDLQDGFIQKVKFISSHALFVIWIGYGLAFGLVIANRIVKHLVRKWALNDAILPPVRAVLCCLGLLVAAIPIYENYHNEDLIFAMSGAEQNGHDFGWQFGNYQLRGADAITEELEADEEPLPNPVYPPEMTDNAVFFGGTDPGRFVPTYMIYSAHVRSDVFLITQNALADNTYMNTMRDLYGNDMWIPTPDDSAKAFQIYVDEVKAGKRPANASLTIDNGRVQVSGALGVMEINGILCDMMFKKNKVRHDFYIEESYVIRWMYPYLSPHGLIMKIEKDKTKHSKELMQNDMDFWDWYTRRLTSDPAFRRDLPAQKSFSKLRSAIAGLYSNTGNRALGEEAYREARVLYPLSPEAGFRMLQEVLLPQGRYEEAQDILTYFVTKDPNNQKAQQFLAFVVKVNTTQKKIKTIVDRGKKDKKLSSQDAYELAMSYREIGQNQSAVHYLKRLAANGAAGLPGNQRLEVALALSTFKQHEDAVKVMDMIANALPPDVDINVLLRIAGVYKDAKKVNQYSSMLMRILKVNPRHWQSWLEIAEVYRAKGQMKQMQYALQKAFTIGQNPCLQALEKKPELKNAAIPIIRQMIQQNSSAMPGVGR